MGVMGQEDSNGAGCGCDGTGGLYGDWVWV